MNKKRLPYWILIVGLIAVVSSSFSIRPASEYWQQELNSRYASDPESVSAQELVLSKDHEGMTALSILLIGVPSFIILTITAIIIGTNTHRKKAVVFALGSTWICLGGILHIIAWY